MMRWITLTTLTVIGLTTLFLVDSRYRAQVHQGNARALAQAGAETQNRIQVALATRLGVVEDLRAFTLAPASLPDNETFNRFAANVLNHNPLSSLGYIDSNRIVRYIYPLKGNEQAIGLDLMTRPAAPFVEKAIRERRATVNDPTISIIGLLSLTSRIPLFQGDQLLGLVFGSFEVPPFLAEVSTGADLRFAVQLQDANGHRFWGVETISGETQTLPIQVGDNAWTLTVGWQSLPPEPAPLTLGLIWGVGGALLLSLLFIVNRTWTQTEWLRTTVSDRTAALRESEGMFRTLVNASSQSVWRYRPGPSPINEIDSASAAWWREFTGQTEAQRTADGGMGWLDAVHEEDRASAQRSWLDLLKTSEPVRALYRARRQDGEWRWLSHYGLPYLFDAQGVVTEWAGTVSDITERMQAEEALRESEERYRDLVENSRELICTHDLDGLVLSANPAAAAAVGYDLDEYVGKKTIRDLLAPEVSHQFDEYMARLRKEGATSGIMLVQTKSGERRVWDYYNSLRTEGVAAPIVRGMARDITDRVRAEESSRHYRERLEALIHSVDGIVWEADARTFQFTFVSAQAERILGFPCEQWINEPSFWHDHIHPEDRDQAVRYCVESTARKLPHEFEYRMIAQDGRAVWLRDLVTVQVEHDQPVTLRGVMLDVTARKHAEETLLASERKHRDIFTFAPVGICQSLRDGTIITANKALAEMLAYDSVDEFLKVNLADVYFTPDEREKLIREYEGPGYASDIELRWKQKDGSPIWIQLSAHVIKGSDGLTKYFEGFVRDIAERKRTELERDVISEVIQSVNLTANLDELLTHVHQSLKRVLYAENCCVALYDKQTGLFEAPLSVDLAEANPFPMTLSKNCTARVFSSGQPLLMNEAIFDELLDRGEVELIGRTAPSLLAAPLMTPGETIGVIVVQHYEKNNVYSQRDVEFLSAVAAQLALAIERKRAEEALKKSESDYRHLFNNANDAILIFESEGEIILEANAAACDVYGFSRDELIGTSLKRLTKSVLAGESQIKQLLDAGKSRNYESIQFNNKGEEIYFLINASVIDYQDRQAILSINHNITERKRQEEALRESEAMLKQSQRVAVLGHYVFDAATGFWTSSEVLDEIFGIDAAYTKNVEGWLKIVHPEQRDEIDAYLRDHVLKEGNSFDREYRIVRINDGAVRWVHGLGNLEFNTEGQPARMFGVIQDITERKQAEESLRQLSGRLLHLQDEERRRIARELHDTTGQSLAALTMNLSVLGASATTLEPKARKALFQSLALAESSSREIRTLSYLLHPPLLDEVGLISAVRWYTDGFSQRSGIAVDLDITSELGRLPSDVEITLFRIVQEALTNAHHHAASKSVRIRFERISSEVSLEIKDKGHGIPPETLKSIRIGSAKIGVGIAGMRERVNQLGGRLEINSSKRGTSVTAILPVDRWNA